MKITGNAKVDFIKYFWNKVDFDLEENSIIEYENNFFYHYEEIHQQASLIDWLDSVGIYLELGCFCLNNKEEYYYNIQENDTLNGINPEVYTTRREATKQAINKAIEIYNNR